MAKIKPYYEREAWLLSEIAAERSVDVLNRFFVERYAEFTGTKVVHSMWGAGWCALLSKDLRIMARARLLKKGIAGLSSGAWQPGFPKWVYTYRLSGFGQEILAAQRTNT